MHGLRQKTGLRVHYPLCRANILIADRLSLQGIIRTVLVFLTFLDLFDLRQLPLEILLTGVVRSIERLYLFNGLLVLPDIESVAACHRVRHL